jgi:hypothetical protein
MTPTPDATTDAAALRDRLARAETRIGELERAVEEGIALIEDDFVMDDFFVIGVIERMRAALTPTAPYDGAARAGDAT